MKNHEDLVPIVVGLFGLLALALVTGCTMVPIHDADGEVTGVGPKWVAVDPKAPAVLDQVGDGANQILDLATSPAVLGLSTLLFGGGSAYAARSIAAKRERDLYERERERERQAWDEAKLEQLRLQNTTGVNS